MPLFRKKQHWFRSAFKALVFAGIMFRIAMRFMRRAEKQTRKVNRQKKIKPKK